MIDTAVLTISGNVVANPRVTGDVDNPDRVGFRVVSNRRKRDPQTGEWSDADEFGINVVCWRRLARGVAYSIHKGDPVLVRGRISSHDYQDKDGTRKWMTEVTADFVGHDLSQGEARFHRFNKLERPTTGDEAATGSDAAVGDGTADDAAPDAAGAQPDGFGGSADDVFGSAPAAEPSFA